MPKLFVVSDIHSFYTPLKKALDEAAFDLTNKNHWLIVCGDVFDRGEESEEVFKYLMSLERKILVKGNHDILLEELCNRGLPYINDIYNGTAATVYDLGEQEDSKEFDKCCRNTWNRLARYRELLVNYFETKNYIFVHSWIPMIDQAYDENWRNATDSQWEGAMWDNPFKLAEKELNKTGKTIVFGHWHCSNGHKLLGHCEDEFEDDDHSYVIWEPCYFKNDTIGIDRCTAHTGKVNVLVLEDDFLE
jgi:serine/threonine protein phosphatase 1